ncbi:hypothetical protein POX_g08897 [Penicillium oxalicum]|uniref:hypothetical protein n=1 Tax=Penicillium oxalicum TaxID=69781 RepID=UPI0020B73F2D|nr:hypothetical protein POX_g08897 [Penicillium oxalicum]KAI2786511.1 hypothetical protein POX_g08897 [Penicillium oxalicum]
MGEHGDLQRQILQKTLKEVADDDVEDADPCVICLDAITEPCVGIPCHHANFDYLCLLSWLEQQPNCPLCKASLSAVQFDLKGPGGPKTYKVPPLGTTNVAPRPSLAHQTRSRRQQSRRQRFPVPGASAAQNNWLSVRRNVYHNRLYSLRVGSNRLSRYTEVTPNDFNRDEALVSRARKWIRRELQVFSFLHPETEDAPPQPRNPVPRAGQQRLEQRRANNAEFLLEYIIAILRTVDIKGSAGQAEELLRDFLGRENARLFLHELLAWLRSPYTSLEDWDRHVQYPTSTRGSCGSRAPDERSPQRRSARSDLVRGRSTSPSREPDRSLFERVSRPQPTRPDRSRERSSRPVSNRGADWPERNRHLLDRYIPD